MKIIYNHETNFGVVKQGKIKVGTFYKLENGKWVITLDNYGSFEVNSRDELNKLVVKKLK